jgi:hypothetical protein
LAAGAKIRLILIKTDVSMHPIDLTLASRTLDLHGLSRVQKYPRPSEPLENRPAYFVIQTAA